MKARVVASAILVLALSPVGAAQVVRDRQQAPRDKPADPSGTGVIAGVVVTADERQEPVRRVNVLLASGQIVTPRTAVTDDTGRFEFGGLAPGNYTLVGQKAAWVPSVYGARSATDTQGVPISVGDGQRVDGLRLPMMRGGVVSGTVRQVGGQPAADWAIQVLRVNQVDGRRQLATAVAPTQTDDTGAYRVFGLAPGEYVVIARSPLNFMAGAGNVRQVTGAEVRWADLQLQQAQAAVAGSSMPGPPEGPTVTYTAAYFPGTSFAADATAISVRAGEERANVDFSLVLERTARVSGTVMGPDGQPAASALVTLEPTDTEGALSGDIMGVMMRAIGSSGRTTSKPDGTFVISGVTPGRYSLTARATPKRPNAAATPDNPEMAEAMALMATMSGMFGGAVQNPATLWAAEPLAVNGQDVGPISLALRDGLKVEGSIVVEGGGVPPDVTSIRLQLTKPSSGDPAAAMIARMTGASTGPAKEDGTFVVAGLTPGRYQVNVTGKPMRMGAMLPGIAPAQSGWVVKSIRWRDQDLADTGIDLQADVPVSGVVVSLTNQPAELSGRVIDAAGRPTGAFPIVVFSADRAQWGLGSRRVIQAQPASDGRYTVVGMPAGQYYLAAVTRLEPGDLGNRQFLEDLVPASLTITIGDGEKKTQDLKLAGGG